MDEPKTSLIANHYDVLGVSQTAADQEIRDAEMAMRKAHDHRAHQGDAAATDMLRRLNEASVELLDARKRAAYDRKPQTSWESFADVAHSPPLARGERFAALRGSGERDILREATLLDSNDLHHLLTRQGLLGDG